MGFGSLLDRSVAALLGRMSWPVLRSRFDGSVVYHQPRHAVFMRAIRLGGYEPFTYALFKSACKKGMTVVDGGAHLGVYTLLAARLVGTEGRVHAFEPHPHSAALLRRSLIANGVDPRVALHEAALSDSSASGFLYSKTRGNQSAASLITRADRGVAHRVAKVRLDDLVADPVDLVKLDLEGAELAALGGMRNILDRNEDLILFVECNPAALRLTHRSSADLFSTLTSYGFEINVIDEHCTVIRRMTELDLAEQTRNLLCTRSQSSIDTLFES
jgi:FkbM family methyltransferase